MKNRGYWRQRELNNERRSIRDTTEIEREIERINQRMIDECSRQINDWLQKYAKQEGINLSEAKRRVSKLAMEEYERYAKELTERGAVKRRDGQRVTYDDFTKEENEQMRLYNLTMKINRLELLKSKLGLATVDGYAELRNYLGDKLTDATLKEMKRQAGILGEYSGVLQMDPKKAAAIVNGSFKGATFSQRLWKNQQELKQTLDAGLTSALIRGQSSAEVASFIRSHFAGDFRKAGKAALRLAVTEMARVEIEAQKDSYERNGFEEYTFNATGPHPCDICQALDGQHFKVSEMVSGDNAPPMHPWCHCTTSAYAGDRATYDQWLDSGAARDGVSLEDFKALHPISSEDTEVNN